MAKATTPKVADPKAAKPTKKSAKVKNVAGLGIDLHNGIVLTDPLKQVSLPPKSAETIDMESAIAARYLSPLVEKAKATVPPHVAAIRTIEAHMAADKYFAEAVRHNLDGMLFTAAKSRTVRRNKANISFIDLEEIVKEIAPNIMRIFENH